MPDCTGIRDLNENYRNRAGSLFGRERGPRGACNDQLDRKADELSGKLRQQFGTAIGEAPLDCEVLPSTQPRSRSPCWKARNMGVG